jgi:uncharacterized SAM-binding protein YcdF (DUF218 family)
MFFEISKFLDFIIIAPLTWMTILFIVAFVTKKKKLRRGCFIAAIAIFLIFTDMPLADWAGRQATKSVNAPHMNMKKPYKAALVMGGFAEMDNRNGMMKYSEFTDRLWEAVRLWRAGHVQRIVISGDCSSNIDSEGYSTAGLFLNYMESLGIPRFVFILEQRALNTRQNATYCKQIVDTMHIRNSDCLLITSAIHMPRTLRCFAKVGMPLDYYPVGQFDSPAHYCHLDFYPKWEAAIKWERIINEWIGRMVYRMVGYN